jgi:hypothetical protein
MYAFVDATAFIAPGSLAACADKFKECREVLVIGGVPNSGRSAQRLREVALRNGGIGQFFATRRELLDDLVFRRRQIPVGLYRGDGLLTGFIVHESNGRIHREPKERIACTPSVEYSIRPLSPFRLRDVKVYYNRLIRQARGRIENQAWNSIIWEHGFDALPRFGDELILTWLKNHSPRREGLLGNLWIWLALRRVRTWKKPAEEQLIARPVFRNDPQS